MTTTNYDVHSDSYRPTNVRVEFRPDGVSRYFPDHKFVVLDFDGAVIGSCRSREQAGSRRKQRAGVIKAALTRRANKVRAAKAGA